MRLRARVRATRFRKRSAENPLFSENLIPKLPNIVFVQPPGKGLLCVEDHLVSKLLRKGVSK
jgi:hypothetical protein